MLKKYWSFLLAIGLLFAYWPSIESGKLAAFDDHNVVEPMAQVDSLSTYWQMRNQGKIDDVQPLRDLSFSVDYFFSKNLGLWTFNLTNVIIWWLFLLLVRELFILQGLSESGANVLILFFAFDPVFASSVGWLSARKHLLTAFFTAAATLLLLKNSEQKLSYKKISLLVILYLLACASQPINIAWPAFATVWLIYKKRFNHRALVLSLSLAVIGAIFAYWNFDYYTHSYLLGSRGTPKIYGYTFSALKLHTLAFGRFFFQSVLPIQPGIWDHYVGSPFGPLGLGLFLATILALWWRKYRDGYLWIFYFSVSLAPVLFERTNVFAADQYLLNAAIGVWMIIAYAAAHVSLKPAQLRACRIGFTTILIIFIFATRAISGAWTSDIGIWQMAYALEPSPIAGEELASKYLEQNQPDLALAPALEAWNLEPGRAGLSRLICSAANASRTLSHNEKLQIFKDHPSRWSQYFIASDLATENRWAEAFSEIKKYSGELRHGLDGFGRQTEVVAAEGFFICRQSNSDECDQWLENFKQTANVKEWDQSAFTRRLQKLSNGPQY